MVQMQISLTNMNANKLLISELRIHDHSNEQSSLKLVPKVVPPADKTATSQQELELLFIPMYEEYFNAGNPSVSKTSALSDNLQQHDTQPTANIHPTSEPINPPTNVNVEEIISQAVIKIPMHYPCDYARTFRVILFSIHIDEWKSFQSQHQIALRKRIFEKRTKNEAKNDKTEHGMEKREKSKSTKTTKEIFDFPLVLSSVNHLKHIGIDLLALCNRKIGIGSLTSFWNEAWSSASPLKNLYPRIYMLDSDKGCTVSSRLNGCEWSSVLRRPPRGGVELLQFNGLMSSIGEVALSDHKDSWLWSLNSSNEYTVAFVRALVDADTLVVDTTATRWNRNVLIKVNVFLWRLALNKLPSKVNLDRIGIDVDSTLCSICGEDVETVNHIFFSCEMAKDLWALLAKWWSLDIPICSNFSEWSSWLGSLHLSSKKNLFLDGVGGTLLWSIWNFRNRLLFTVPPPKKAVLWNNIVSQSFL
ncbi:RNA-directed DNA polymerase, eukaryota, reverse transcriptase zinc-binding domain protein [Tanacetum coccineum]